MDMNSMIAAIAAFVDKVEKLEQRIAELEDRTVTGSADKVEDLETRLEEIESKVMEIEERAVMDYDLDDKVQEIVRGMTFTVSVE